MNEKSGKRKKHNRLVPAMLMVAILIAGVFLIQFGTTDAQGSAASGMPIELVSLAYGITLMIIWILLLYAALFRRQR